MRIFALSAQRLRKLNDGDDGQALVLVCIGLMMLLMMAGLGVDVGYLHYQKQQMQKAADAAAIAAAEAMTYGGNWHQAGVNDATANGFTDGVGGATVVVRTPPLTAGDPFAGNTNYVEAIVSQPAAPTFFMKVAGAAFSSVNVSSRAVASIAASGPACMYAMDPSSPKTFLLNGGVSVASTCGVEVNSNDPDALHMNGSGSLNAGAAGIGVVGGWSGSGFTPTPVTLPGTFPDPLQNLAEPVPTSCVAHPTQTVINGGGHLDQGTYCGGIKLGGGGTVTFGPGLYILCNGGMSSGGGVVLTGTDVTIYNTGHARGVSGCTANAYAPVTITGGGGTNLSAPTTGTYGGILFFQDRNYISDKNVDASSFDGSSGATFTGALYFPFTNLTYAGNPNSVVSSVIIAWQLTFSGNVSLNNNLLLDGSSPIQTAGLAE